MRRILFITNTSYTLLSLRINLMKSLISDGYYVMASAPKDKYSEKLTNEGIDFYNIPMSQTGTNIFEEILTTLSIVFLFIKTKPNLVHLFSIKSILWGGLAAIFFRDIKVISTFTGMGILRSASSNLLKNSLFLIIKLSHNDTKNYVFQNHSDLILFKKRTGIKHNLNLIEGSGVDTDYFKRINDVKKANNKITFLMFSRMLLSKGVLDYLQAIKKINKDLLDKAEFILLGGRYPRSIKDVDKEWLSGIDVLDSNLILFLANQSNVTWLKHDSNILNYLSISDVVVLPSYYPEGLPRSLLEAMSCENVIITSKTPGCEDVVDGTNGFLIEKKNTQQLAEMIEECIKMSHFELKIMRKRSREIVKDKFSDKIIIAKYKELYQKI